MAKALFLISFSLLLTSFNALGAQKITLDSKLFWAQSNNTFVYKETKGPRCDNYSQSWIVVKEEQKAIKAILLLAQAQGKNIVAKAKCSTSNSYIWELLEAKVED